MSGIDIPTKKFELLPRAIYNIIGPEAKQKQAEKRAKKKLEASASAIKEEKQKRLNQDLFVQSEVNWIIATLASKFDSHKNELIMGEYASETFEFEYYCSQDCSEFGLWERTAQEAKIAIDKLVPTSNWQLWARAFSLDVSLVAPATEQTQ